MKFIKPKKFKLNGFTSIDLLLGSSLLSTLLAVSSQISNTSFESTNSKLQASKINSAIASRIETVREVAFYHLCQKNTDPGEASDCRSNHIDQPRYDLTKLKPYCDSNTLGSSLLNALKSHKDKLAEDFNLTDYDKSAQPVLISTNIRASNNQIELSFESINRTPVTTIIVPKAEGWCA